MAKFRITSVPQNKKLNTFAGGGDPGVYILDGYKYKKDSSGNWTYESGQPINDIDNRTLIAKLNQQAKPVETPAITLAPKPKPTLTQKKTEYANLVNSPLIANQERAQSLGSEISEELKQKDLYEPDPSNIIHRGKGFETTLNSALDYPMTKASIAASASAGDGSDEIDNLRHPLAGRYTAEAVMNYFPEWMQYTGIPQATGFLGANAMGIAHEADNIFKDARPWSSKLRESGEDIFNNAVGAGVGILPMSSKDKTDALLELSNNNMLPDGMVTPEINKSGFSNNMYFKKGPNDPGKFRSPYKQEYGGSLDTYAGGGAACPRGYVRDASGKCVPYNFNDVQAADSYKGMYGGYDKKGVKNLKQEIIVAKKGKKFSDYVLRGGKTKADMAKKLGKDAGQYFGMPGEALQPTNFTKAGLEKYNKTIKDAKKNFEAEEKNREEYDNALKKKESGKMSTDKFARQYKEKGWADKYDPATMKEGYKGQFQDAVDEANARKTENYELVKNVAGELSGYNAAGRIYDDPLGTLKGVGQTVADVASLPFGLTTGVYNYATDGNFDMGQNIIGQNYGEGLDEVGDVASILPFGSMLGTAGKAAKLTKAGDVAGDLGKFITTQTPVKNTYKVLGRDSKFFNPGEQPNWLKGYQQTWDPDVADLAPLAEFDKKLKTPELIPKFKKQYQSITDKKNSITTDYRKKIQKAKDNPELIKKAEQERESAMAKMTEATDKFEADVLNYNIKKYSPFEKQIGSGGFGKVFSIPGSDKVVKIGRQAPGEIPEELIKRAQGLDKPNVAIPNRIENLEGIVDATVMKKVDNLENSPESLFSGTHVKPTSQAYEQLVYDIQDLQDRGLYADFQNPDNIIFNPQTGKYHIYDLNTTGHYMSKNITPEMGYKFKADTQFPGIQVPDTEGHSVLKILKDQGKVPKNFELPNYADLETTKIADDLTFRKVNPYKTKNTDNDYGKTLVAHVTKGEGLTGDQAISLRKYKQPSGEEAYYFNANMKNPIEAGKAFKKLESQIPKGAIIQEPASLSLDSWSALLRQAQNPKKFQVYPGNKVPLNTEAVHKKLPNQDKLLRGLEDEMGWESKMASYATREDAQEAADYINTLIPKEFRATKANVFQNDPKKEIYNIAVPNYRIKKMYKQGGQSNDYIEMDIPKSKVQWYIDNGYDVEVLE